VTTQHVLSAKQCLNALELESASCMKSISMMLLPESVAHIVTGVVRDEKEMLTDELPWDAVRLHAKTRPP